MKRFSGLPVHKALLGRAVEVLKGDGRVLGLYVSGSPDTDEFSDVDLMILSTAEDRVSLERDRVEIASRVGEIRAEAMAMVPHTYVVNYAGGVKMDYCFHVAPERPRPDKALIDIMYDPTGQLAVLVEESRKLAWDIDTEELQAQVKHYYVTFSYTAAKLERGELWDARDCVEWYRARMIHFEDVLAQRKRENYRRLERKLSPERLSHLESTIPRDLSRRELVRCTDECMGYFERYLKGRLQELGAHPDKYAENMNKHYRERRERVLTL